MPEQSEELQQAPEKPDVRLLLRATMGYLGWGLVFAPALAVVLTILFFGLRIIRHGIPMCGTLAQAGMWDRILYTSCGCALVELLLLAVCGWALRISTPRLWRQLRAVRHWQRPRE